MSSSYPLLKFSLLIMTMCFVIFPYPVQASETLNVGDNDDVFLPLVFQVSSELATFEEQVLTLTNQARQAHGCGLLTMDARLKAAAENHSEDMAVNDYIAHNSLDGTEFWERILNQGYHFSTAGENIAAGYSSPESVVAGWMSSPGHRANILNCEFVHIGVGYYYLQNDTGMIDYHHYWTQDFASP